MRFFNTSTIYWPLTICIIKDDSAVVWRNCWHLLYQRFHNISHLSTITVEKAFSNVEFKVGIKFVILLSISAIPFVFSSYYNHAMLKTLNHMLPFLNGTRWLLRMRISVQLSLNENIRLTPEAWTGGKAVNLHYKLQCLALYVNKLS